jgi:8-oxo-dGTP diphosphatase
VADSFPVLGVAAKAIVVNGGGEVLLIRRSPRSSTDPGCWDLPGGKMDARELLADTLVREVGEETGLTVSAAEARPFHVSNFVKEPFWVTCVTFACPSFEGEVRLSVEHVEHRWVTPGGHRGLRYARAIEEQLDAYASLR